MSNALLAGVCECGKGMIPDIRRMTTRCYACLKECDKFGNIRDFDPTGEFIQFTANEVVHAMLAVVLGLMMIAEQCGWWNR